MFDGKDSYQEKKMKKKKNQMQKPQHKQKIESENQIQYINDNS